jgi:ArsR family transcriptional regulator
MVEARREGKWMHYHMVTPANSGAAQVLRQTLDWLSSDKAMQTDRARLTQACCNPAKFIALEGAPAPASVKSAQS